jgi:hypothetical protein
MDASGQAACHTGDGSCNVTATPNIELMFFPEVGSALPFRVSTAELAQTLWPDVDLKSYYNDADAYAEAMGVSRYAGVQ